MLGKCQRINIRFKSFVLLAQTCSDGRQELREVAAYQVALGWGEGMPAGKDFGLKADGGALSYGRKAFGANVVLRAVQCLKPQFDGGLVGSLTQS